MTMVLATVMANMERARDRNGSPANATSGVERDDDAAIVAALLLDPSDADEADLGG